MLTCASSICLVRILFCAILVPSTALSAILPVAIVLAAISPDTIVPLDIKSDVIKPLDINATLLIALSPILADVTASLAS